MRKFNDYDKVKVNNFEETEKITAGGHICKILDASIVKVQSQKSNEEFEKLRLKIDISEPDESAGFYARKFQKDAQENALEAKWKGFYEVFVPKDDGTEKDEKAKTIFKTLITSVEESNEGYDWEKANWDEKTLAGKLFGGVFGIEEFENLTGTIVWNTKCKFVRSTKDIQNVKPPKVRLVDNSYMEYEEWEEKRKNTQNGQNAENNSNNSSTIDDDDDLPF